MAGPNLEVFKFGLYVMLPVCAMYYFGHPDFYNQYVRHLNFWPRPEEQPRIPYERHEIKEELAKLREERLQRRQERLLREDGRDTP